MKKRIFTLISMLVMSSLFIGCTKAKEEKTIDSDKIQVTVSIEPLKEFTQIIGGDKVEVKTMVPTGSEPHDFEPKTKDLVELNNADIFVYNGLNMEEWIDKVLGTIENENLVIVDSSTGTTVIEHSEEEHNHEEEEHSHEEDEHSHSEETTTEGDSHSHEHGPIDPHIWLSVKESKVQAANIKDALIKIDSKNSALYEENYNKFVSDVDGLYNEYKPKFDSLANKNFVTGHAAFGYVCRDFGLNEESVENILGEGEITPQRLTQLVEFSKEHNVKTIFMPELASEKVAQTLANEVGASVEKIYSLESMEDNLTYIEAMKSNLDKIYTALSSQQ